MENHFQEEFASLEDKTKAGAQVFHVFQYGRLRSYEPASRITAATSWNQGDIGRTYDPKIFKMTQYPAGSGAKHDWNRVRPRTSNANTTEIEYVLVVRTQLRITKLQITNSIY